MPNLIISITDDLVDYGHHKCNHNYKLEYKHGNVYLLYRAIRVI